MNVLKAEHSSGVFSFLNFRGVSTLYSIFLIVIFLTAFGCGGGGGGGSSSASPPASPPSASSKVTGVASTGAVIQGTVTLKDQGGTTRSVNIGSDGSFSIDVSGLTAPFILTASGTSGGQNVQLYSVATSANTTANINPLSNWCLASAGKVNDPATVYANPSAFSSAVSNSLNQSVSDLQAFLKLLLDALGLSNTNPITASITAFTGMDLVFDAINIQINPSTGAVTITLDTTGQTVAQTSSISLSGVAPISQTEAVKTANAIKIFDGVQSGLTKLDATKSLESPIGTLTVKYPSTWFVTAGSEGNAAVIEVTTGTKETDPSSVALGASVYLWGPTPSEVLNVFYAVSTTWANVKVLKATQNGDGEAVYFVEQTLVPTGTVYIANHVINVVGNYVVWNAFALPKSKAQTDSALLHAILGTHRFVPAAAYSSTPLATMSPPNFLPPLIHSITPTSSWDSGSWQQTQNWSTDFGTAAGFMRFSE